MSFKWNEVETIISSVWDPSINEESFFTTVQSIKERLQNPVNGKRPGDQLADIGKGLALIMDYLESKEESKVEATEPILPAPMTDAEFRKEHDGHNWVYTDQDCPSCQNILAENSRGVYCPSRGCGYRK